MRRILVSNSNAVHLTILLLLSVLLWLPRLRGPLDLRTDGSVYYILGTSLAEGKGYRLLNEPGEIQALQYPPLLPLIVGTHQRLLGTSDILVVGTWLRVFYFFVYVGFTVAVYCLVRAYLAPGWAFLAACVCSLDLNTYYLSDMMYTEIPFTLVSTLFVILNRKAEKTGHVFSTAMLGAAAYLLRTAGIALLAAWVTESLLGRRFKQMAVRAAVALVPIVLWQAHIAQVKNSQQYQQPAYAYQRAPYQYSNVTYFENMLLVKPFTPELGRVTSGEMSRRIAGNLIALPTALGEALSAPIWFWEWPLRFVNKRMVLGALPLWLVKIPLVMLGGLTVVGLILLTGRGELFVPLYFAGTVGLLLLTPFPEQFPRYLTPLTPFVALSLFITLKSFSEFCSRGCGDRWKKVGLGFGVLMVTVIILVEGLSLAGIYWKRRYAVSYSDATGKEVVHQLFFYYPAWRALDMSLEWVRQRADSGDVIATTEPHWAYLRTGLKAVLPPMVTDVDQANRLLDSVPTKYVILDSLDYPGISQRYTVPVIENNHGLWKCVYVAPGAQARVYERVQGEGELGLLRTGLQES